MRREVTAAAVRELMEKLARSAPAGEARVGNVEFFHHDAYAQLLSTIVRGFRMDVLDARRFCRAGW